jgi:LysR family hydrogen peroxide-inducible transcriptional activator
VSVPAHPVSLRQLQYAVAVADLRSFRRAADRCHVSQPSLSSQVAQLEAALGIRLFERDRRRVSPTGAAQEVLDRARRLLVDAGDLVEAARRLSDPLAGPLRMGILPTISPYLLPAAARALRARHPRLAVTFVEDRTAALVTQLLAGTLDCAVVALPARLGDLEHEVIAEDDFVLATPPGHPLGAPARPVRPEELQGAQVLLLDDSHCLREQALAVCATASAREAAFRATSLPTLAQMVAGGAGVTLLPRLAVALEAPRAGLRIRPFAPPAPRRTLVLAWRRRSVLGPALRQVAATVATAVRSPRSTPRRARR